MSPPQKFLVIDDNSDSRFLLVKTLLRKFPQAVLQECQDGDAAVALTKTENPSAIVVHRAAEVDGLTLVRMLRHVNSRVPIVMVSGIDRSAASLEAGASTFLSYDAWLRIGTVVSDLIHPASPPPERADESTAASAVRG